MDESEGVESVVAQRWDAQLTVNLSLSSFHNFRETLCR